MAVRKIPKNYLTVTGSFASQKNGQMDAFESPLEKEYLLLLEFDETVERFVVQPVTVPVPGVVRGYTPDVLVYFLPDPISEKIRRPLLTEIKHTDDLKRNGDKYKTKFASANQYASDHGWEFRVTTENDIRTRRLQNIKFLREYRNIVPDEREYQRLLDIAEELDEVFSIPDILARLAPDDDAQLHWLPLIWYAILKQDLITDWDQPIDYCSPLSLASEL